MDRIWAELTGGQPGGPVVLEVKGRKLVVPHAAMGVAFGDVRVAACILLELGDLVRKLCGGESPVRRGQGPAVLVGEDEEAQEG